MGKIGFDWGTTTTSLCFYNQEKSAFDYLRFGGNPYDFFSSVIVYRENGRVIGNTAKERMYAKSSDAYVGVKLRLDANAKNAMGRKKSPYEAARDFIGTAIGEYAVHWNNNQPPEGIVFTIPDNWGMDVYQHPSLLFLEQILQDIGFDTDTQVSFYSEPIAAAAYYCRTYGKDFRGTLLVVDFGGGTLDLTLCQAQGANNILVLYRCGASGENQDEPEGCGGEAFDTEAVKRISVANELDLEPNTKKFHKFRAKFEQAKISSATRTNECLRRYYSARTVEAQQEISRETVFTVFDEDDEEYPVLLSDIVGAFETANAESLRRCLGEILGYCQDARISLESDNFRVLQTGGFSNLYCVEAEIRSQLGVETAAQDQRFEGIPMEFRSTAIAHGAGIIAEGDMTVDVLLQKDIGFAYCDPTGTWTENAPLLRREQLLRNLREPTYFVRTLYADSLGENAALSIFVEDRRGRRIREQNLEPLCPTAPDARYRIGLSIGRRQALFLHSVDSEGIVRTTPVLV